MNAVKHLSHVLRWAARNPRIAARGVREFRWDFTTHYDDAGDLESYDSGRELAHMVTFRRFELI